METQQEKDPMDDYVSICYDCGKYKTGEHFTEADKESRINPHARQSCNECRNKDGKI